MADALAHVPEKACPRACQLAHLKRPISGIPEIGW
jgi:hypothetical protein